MNDDRLATKEDIMKELLKQFNEDGWTARQVDDKSLAFTPPKDIKS
jgi:hypothetical protein